FPVVFTPQSVRVGKKCYQVCHQSKNWFVALKNI
ncbi:1-deoxy-D-xylulose-5-phosphate synthase family protein, partial [Vibrio parahaemolyticus V-223/04]